MNLKLNIVIGITILSLIVFFNVPSQPEVYAREKTNLDYLTEYAQQYGVSSKVLYEVMMCESGGNPQAWNKQDPGVGSKGIMQFQTGTFNHYADEIGLQNKDIWNPVQQLQVASYMFSIGEAHQWSCYQKLYK